MIFGSYEQCKEIDIITRANSYICKILIIFVISVSLKFILEARGNTHPGGGDIGFSAQATVGHGYCGF